MNLPFPSVDPKAFTDPARIYARQRFRADVDLRPMPVGWTRGAAAWARLETARLKREEARHNAVID